MENHNNPQTTPINHAIPAEDQEEYMRKQFREMTDAQLIVCLRSMGTWLEDEAANRLEKRNAN